jgi:hypothetical protein
MNWKSRKIWFTVGVILFLGLIVAYTQKDIPPNFARIVEMLALYYLGANTISKFSHKDKDVK